MLCIYAMPTTDINFGHFLPDSYRFTAVNVKKLDLELCILANFLTIVRRAKWSKKFRYICNLFGSCIWNIYAERNSEMLQMHPYGVFIWNIVT